MTQTRGTNADLLIPQYQIRVGYEIPGRRDRYSSDSGIGSGYDVVQRKRSPQSRIAALASGFWIRRE